VKVFSGRNETILESSMVMSMVLFNLRISMCFKFADCIDLEFYFLLNMIRVCLV
jgi:hypothetical protein